MFQNGFTFAEEMEIEKPKDVLPNEVVDLYEVAAQKYSCSKSLVRELYLVPSSMTPDKIYALLNFDASFNSRFFKVENFLAAATVRMNALLGMELGEDDDSNGIGEIISGEVVKLLSVI